MTLDKSKFLAGILVLDTRYKQLKSQNNNLFYSLNGQVNYALAYYFADSETIKLNVVKFLIHLLIKPMIKNHLYQNTNKWIENFFAIQL